VAEASLLVIIKVVVVLEVAKAVIKALVDIWLSLGVGRIDGLAAAAAAAATSGVLSVLNYVLVARGCRI